MALLKRRKRIFILLDLCFELFDIFRSPLSERGLSLSIALLAFLRSSVYLARVSVDRILYITIPNHSYVQAFFHPFAFEAEVVPGKVLQAHLAPARSRWSSVYLRARSQVCCRPPYRRRQRYCCCRPSAGTRRKRLPKTVRGAD